MDCAWGRKNNGSTYRYNAGDIAHNFQNRLGVGVLWPDEKPSQMRYATDAIYSSSEPPEGHTMSFDNALETLLEHLILTLLRPKWILSKLARIAQYLTSAEHAPIRVFQVAHESYSNWYQYMNELLAQKIEETPEGKQTEGLDIMGSLIRSPDENRKTRATGSGSPGRAEQG